jgi:exodeoxyribonuclease VII small subunit
MAARKFNFEKSMDRIKEIVSLLEEGGSSLEDSVKLYEEGANLTASCYKMLEDAEQRIKIVPLKDEVNGDE